MGGAPGAEEGRWVSSSESRLLEKRMLAGGVTQSALKGCRLNLTVSGRSRCRSSSGCASFRSGQREGEGEDRGREGAGEGAQAGRSPSPAVLCHRQRQWVWGPDGYGAILLVNCDRDSVRSDDQDNCDRHVRCLQGEGRRATAQLPCPESHPQGRLWRQSLGPEA